MAEIDITEELKRILDFVYEDVLIADGSGRVLFVSKLFEHRYGVSLEEIAGLSVVELEQRGVFNPSITRRVLETRARQSVVQKTLDGHRVLVSGVPIFDEQGELIRIVSYSYDVTELLELREHMLELETEMDRVKSELERLREQNARVEGVIATSPAMRRTVDTALRVAAHDVPVLMLGESGVGKGVLAKLMHSKSPRNKGPFISINCAAIPEALLESELFGYEQGAFTGAKRSGKPGLIELADQGTLFLDEVGELPLAMQAKLLTVIQEHRFFRVGGQKELFSDFRLIAATNQDLERMVAEGRFRKDLYFRLNIVPLVIPPLRERRDDIIPLARHFAAEMCRRHGVQRTLSSAVLQRFHAYDWPGNVRELENMVERLIVLAESKVVTEADLPSHLLGTEATPVLPPVGSVSLPALLDAYERRILEEARKRARSTMQLAKLLGISQPTVVRKLRKHFGNAASRSGQSD
ncbi:sigma-54 interaction domain-containing protein [Alicyclobacillus shizuokensis]|uniref:sigma-54 interaction domain-containing protein n=1 Tax=Alicyclobacillus shizuokensis TaxID=392014 RepID=UPI00082E2FB4|nr:sigma 54-interacting transcriptional regulator [Alicyclobacillus shizuokensis]